jgi:D-methionine transport system substrate-binding protein
MTSFAKPARPKLMTPRQGVSAGPGLKARARRSILGMALASTLALFALPILPAPAVADTVRVGIIGGEDEDLWKVVAAQAAMNGLTIKTVVFNDYTQPNEALERGDIEANAFQHKPYLDNQIKTRGYHIAPVGFTAVWPIGLYSRKVRAVAALPRGSIIGVPNDPSNEGRALILLQRVGLIKLRDGAGILATTLARLCGFYAA